MLRRRPSQRVWPIVFRYVVPLIVTLGLCYILFAKSNLQEMAATVRRDCQPQWILAALGVSVFSHIFRAMRWRIQLKAIGVDTPLFIVVLSIFGTYAVNLVLPRLGEVWRTGYIASRQRAPFDSVFGSMIADRFADALSVASIIALTLIISGHQLIEFLSANSNSAIIDAVVAAVTSFWFYISILIFIGVCVMALYRFKHATLVERINRFLIGLWRGFIVVLRMKGRYQWLVLTVAVWGCYFFQFYLTMQAFPLTAKVTHIFGLQAVLVCFVISSLSMVIPSNGGIGPWQMSVILALGLYAGAVPGLTEQYASAFANVVMGSQTLLLITLGLFTFIAVAIDRRRNRKENIEKNV